MEARSSAGMEIRTDCTQGKLNMAGVRFFTWFFDSYQVRSDRQGGIGVQS